MGTDKYTLGRGEVHFSRYKPGTTVGEGFRYLGNSPDWSITLDTQSLDHFSSDRGIKEKDASIVLEVNRSGSLTLDEIAMENLSYFLFSGDGATTVSEAGGAVVGYAISGALQGRSYQLGEDNTNPSGDMGISTSTAPVVKDSTGTTTYVVMDDYVIDFDRGIITIVEGGDIADDTDIKVDYTVLATTREQVVSGSEKVEGALKYIERNPTGPDKTWTFPRVTLAPNGDLNLKGDDWQQIPLTVEVLKKDGVEAIYINGIPAAAA